MAATTFPKPMGTEFEVLKNDINDKLSQSQFSFTKNGNYAGTISAARCYKYDRIAVVVLDIVHSNTDGSGWITLGSIPYKPAADVNFVLTTTDYRPVLCRLTTGGSITINSPKAGANYMGELVFIVNQ